MSAALDIDKYFALVSLSACGLPRLAQQRLLPKVNRVQRTVPVPTMQALLPANCSICRGSSSSVSAKKEKTRTKFVLSFLWCGLRKTNCAVAPRALHLTLRVLFVCYVRCARHRQILRTCLSLRLRSTETCSTAIVTEGQSRATDGARPNNASIVACKLLNLQGEFKFGVRKKKKKHEQSSCLSFCGAVTET